MKKFLTVLCCLVAMAGIVVLCYFFATPGGGNITMPTGKYYLEKVMSLEGDKETEEDFSTSGLYIEVLEEKKVKSFSGEVGFLEDGKVYSYKVVGTGLSVFDKNNKLVYEGFYVEDMICIFISEKEVNDKGEEEIKKTTEYRYILQTQN